MCRSRWFRATSPSSAVDAIVNAANSSLLGGGGVDGAIHRRGGPEILAECRGCAPTHTRDGLPAGQAVATTAAGCPPAGSSTPSARSTPRPRTAPQLLASCYRESLRVADELGAARVAFPAISAGVYGWPLDDAARIAVAAVRATATPVAEVRFVLFGDGAYAAFTTAANAR